MLEIRWNIFYLYTSLVYNCMTYRWKWRRRGGACGANVSFPLIVNYWFRTLYCSKQVQMMLLQYLIVTLFFPVIFFSFPSPTNVCPINDIKRGAGDRKPRSCVLKLSSFFGRHMIRITGMRNPDAGAGSAKIGTTGCQAPQLVTAV